MHIIHLRGPWELVPLVRYVNVNGQWREATDDLPAGGRTQVPGDWADLLGADFLGRARYTRRFNCPTNLDSHERVWLALEGVDYEAAILLNDRPLGRTRGTASVHRVDITDWLAPHNLLAVDVELPAAVRDDEQARGARCGKPGGLVGEVRLEIASRGAAC
jgi:beta-galactosidase/beta-glucuronidase